MAITVDATLSTSSTNPVQNKAITLELNNKADSSSLPHGVPSGGTTGQVLVKSSNSDYAVEWQTVTVPSGTKNISISSNGTTTENVTNYATASITTNVPASAVDSGTKNISITQNGTTTENVVGYANASISVNVSGGASLLTGTYTPTENTLGPTFNIGTSDFTHFIIYAESNSGGYNVKGFRLAICDFSLTNTMLYGYGTNNSASAIVGENFSTTTWFAKNGSQVTCTNTGTTGSQNAGYWISGITYRWLVW